MIDGPAPFEAQMCREGSIAVLRGAAWVQLAARICHSTWLDAHATRWVFPMVSIAGLKCCLGLRGACRRLYRYCSIRSECWVGLPGLHWWNGRQ